MSVENKSTIPINIAGKEYLFTIEESKIELFRLAERKVNNAVLNLEKRNINDYSKQDAVALVALDFTISNIKLRQQSEIENEDVEALNELQKKITEYLNDPRQ